MATNRKSTLTKVGKAVKKAARTVAAKADKYVVKPVGKALGVKGKKTAAKSSGKKTAKSSSTKKTAGKSAKKSTGGSAKKGAAKSAGRGR